MDIGLTQTMGSFSLDNAAGPDREQEPPGLSQNRVATTSDGNTALLVDGSTGITQGLHNLSVEDNCVSTAISYDISETATGK